MKLMKKFICEFIGTFGLVVLGCGMVICLSKYSPTNANQITNNLVIALTFGLSAMCLTYAFGNASGAHLNPAISLGALITNYLKPKEERDYSFLYFFIYVIAQILGAFLACYALYGLFGKCDFGANQASDFLKDLVGKDNYKFQALVVETFLSFILVLVALYITGEKSNKGKSGIVIGLTLTLVHLSGIPFTGTSVNPARSIAPAVLAKSLNDNNVPLEELWIYIAGPLLGALIAALLYRFLIYRKQGAEIILTPKQREEEFKLQEQEQVESQEEPKQIIVEHIKTEEPQEVKEEEIESIKTEEPQEEPVVEEELKPAVFVPPVNSEDEEDTKLKIKRVSFETKLRKADKDLKDKYKAIKAELESYGVKSRISFEGDSYRLHRIKYAFITIRGKALRLYLNLDLKKYKDSPIPLKDESDKKKYESTPAVLKVRSNLSVRRAVSLIGDIMKDGNIEKKKGKNNKNK